MTAWTRHNALPRALKPSTALNGLQIHLIRHHGMGERQTAARTVTQLARHHSADRILHLRGTK